MNGPHIQEFFEKFWVAASYLKRVGVLLDNDLLWGNILKLQELVLSTHKCPFPLGEADCSCVIFSFSQNSFVASAVELSIDFLTEL